MSAVPGPSTSSSRQLRVQQLALHARRAAPTIHLENLAELHYLYLEAHDAALAERPADIPAVKAIDEKTATRLNQLAREFQHDVALQVGPDAYVKLTGRNPTDEIPLVDLSIVESARRVAVPR